MKAIDCVLPPPTSQLEAWNRWKNHLESELRTLTYYKKVRIHVL